MEEAGQDWKCPKCLKQDEKDGEEEGEEDKEERMEVDEETEEQEAEVDSVPKKAGRKPPTSRRRKQSESREKEKEKKVGTREPDDQESVADASVLCTALGGDHNTVFSSVYIV